MVERLFPLVVSSHDVDAPGFAQGVQFINKDNAGSAGRRLGEKIADAGRPHPNEHFHKLGSTDTEEGHVGLSGHGLGQQGFACPRRAEQEHAFGDLPPQLLEFTRILQKLHHFLKFIFGFVDSGYIGKSDLGSTLGKKLGLAFAERHHSLAGSHLFHRIPPDQEKNADGQDPGKNGAQEFTLIKAGIIYFVFIQFFYQVGILHSNRGKISVLLLLFSFYRSDDAFWTDGQAVHLSFGQVLFKLAVRDCLHFWGKKVLLRQGK